jgi:F0F1-type ATP synthase assembly protein I
MGKPQQKPGAAEGAASAYQRAGPYLDAAWSLTGSVGVWTGVGYFADGWLHTRPWLLVLGSVLGMSSGFYLFFKRLSAADQKARDERRE